jgi:hypothetical protein
MSSGRPASIGSKPTKVSEELQRWAWFNKSLFVEMSSNVGRYFQVNSPEGIASWVLHSDPPPIPWYHSRHRPRIPNPTYQRGRSGNVWQVLSTPNPAAGLMILSGAGNAPQRPELMYALREACGRGVVIVAISQCTRGAVSDAYEAGRTLLQAGVIPGGDMTPEASDLQRTCFKDAESGSSAHLPNSLTCSPNLHSPWQKLEISWVHPSAESLRRLPPKHTQPNPPKRPWMNKSRKSRGYYRTLSDCPAGRTTLGQSCQLQL